MKQWNVVWLVIDGIRTSRLGRDTRDRLILMDEFAKESLVFNRVVTSGLSSVMSDAGALTGVPAYYLARDYGDFDFDPDFFPCLPRILMNLGYKAYGLPYFWEGRQRLASFFGGLVDQEYWPTDLGEPADEYYWTNEYVNAIIRNLFDSDLEEPIFLFVHYGANPRGDPNTSADVRWLINHIKDSGVYERTIIVLTSDHGWPERLEDLKRDFLGLVEFGTSHDMVTTNDNLFTPLLLHYPGVEAAQCDTVVSNLDIAPTILDLLGIMHEYPVQVKWQGRSLLPLINGHSAPSEYESRYLRADTRFVFQLNRITVLVRNRLKYVYCHDQGKEALCDFEADPLEQHNLVTVPEYSDVLMEFRNAYSQTAMEATQFHLRDMLRRFERSLKQRDRRFTGVKSIMIVDEVGWSNVGLVVTVVNETIRPTRLALATKDNYVRESLGHKFETVVWTHDDRSALRQDLQLHHYDLAIVLGPPENSRIAGLLKGRTGEMIFLDANMEFGGYSRWQIAKRNMKAWIRAIADSDQPLVALLANRNMRWQFHRNWARVQRNWHKVLKLPLLAFRKLFTRRS